jgi:hypothetical protein
LRHTTLHTLYGVRMQGALKFRSFFFNLC